MNWRLFRVDHIVYCYSRDFVLAAVQTQHGLLCKQVRTAADRPLLYLCGQGTFCSVEEGDFARF